jgi:hypothetical protein
MPFSLGNSQGRSHKRGASLRDVDTTPHRNVAHVLVALDKTEKPQNAKWCKLEREVPFNGDGPERWSNDVIWYQLNRVWYRFNSKTGAHQKLVPASFGVASSA